MKLTKEILKQDPDIEDSFITEFIFNDKKIKLRLDPDDVSIDDTLILANNMLENFDVYFKNAEDIIVKDFLDNYNENWSDSENGFPELNEQGFRDKLELSAINFLSKDSIDVFFNESGMFGNHSLIAQSFDGVNFEDTTMYG
ncbi:DUF2262 domain-containing protein [uncultured Aquimarina sp.]|uniref:DUF2262 domain-containing protein n=1 Tax=uncultured Aquimarina sp. TaxID=575652 RepID=UPI00261A25CA|nr:DUF2262 domain-containing protein [uncultured Aquimarina sp.]